MERKKLSRGFISCLLMFFWEGWAKSSWLINDLCFPVKWCYGIPPRPLTIFFLPPLIEVIWDISWGTSSSKSIWIDCSKEPLIMEDSPSSSSLLDEMDLPRWGPSIWLPDWESPRLEFSSLDPLESESPESLSSSCQDLIWPFSSNSIWNYYLVFSGISLRRMGSNWCAIGMILLNIMSPNFFLS